MRGGRSASSVRGAIRADAPSAGPLPPPVSPAEAARFHRDGYVVLPATTDAPDVAFLRAIAVDLFARRAGEREGAYFDFSGRSERGEKPGLQQILDPRSHAPRLTRARFFLRAAEIACALLGPEARFCADHILLKPAHHGTVTPWHQDDAFRDPRIEATEISIWLPLQAVDEHNGCLRFVPGSHRAPVLRHRPAGGDVRAHGLECDEAFDLAQAISCPLEIGGCTVHGGRTLHCAGPNASPDPRYAYVLVFGLPPRYAADPVPYPWLVQRDPDSERRRRAWMRRGGFLVHAGRRMRQLRQVGPLVLSARLVRKLRLRVDDRRRL